MGKHYTGPKYFYGAWLSLGKLFFVLHINNVAYERDMTDFFKFYIGWDTLHRKLGEALYSLFELRWSKSRGAQYNNAKSGFEFHFSFGKWFLAKNATYTMYNIFGKSRTYFK